MKKIMGIFIGILMCSAYIVGAPVTQTTVPSTHPKTSVTVFRPTTKPSGVTRLPTFSTVSHPKTTVTVTRPATPGSTTETVQAGTAVTQVATSSAATVPAAKPAKQGVDNTKPSMMSTYQPKQAKDLKAAKLGKTDGLGNKDNRAEKDAAAASLQVPKAKEASMESIQQMQNTSGSNLKSKLADAFGK